MKNEFGLEVLPAPTRAFDADDPAELLAFAVESFRRGPVAIGTLVGIRGGAARALGSHVIIADDGRFAGYVSGGCVEAAVAFEALQAMREGRDRTVSFGDGSPFMDIVLPCGGGITVAIHILREIDNLELVLDHLKRRQRAALRYSPSKQSLVPVVAPRRAGWLGEDFISVYRPQTRVVISGQTLEAQSVARLAEVAGYDVVLLPINRADRIARQEIDAFSAVVVLHHDLEKEMLVLPIAMESPAFYIGALGSTRTHGRRIERLAALGHRVTGFSRLKAPIGMFGPARDSSSLALSVLADIAATRLATFE
ncbi:XdhC family protein [Sinorhizobium garamanticum]|uniref:XdhC family protein n=1 Tax=Sinorhizobium garamanticum TaxID=680247 RepID=A0ABY8DJF3_9HYPH|nr:XdhC family protein [Sinorhizobium garamanticum]WEX91055.1 XdhC family protein [Sinorhizobium garamanticum]